MSLVFEAFLLLIGDQSTNRQLQIFKCVPFFKPGSSLLKNVFNDRLDQGQTNCATSAQQVLGRPHQLKC